MMKNSRRAVCLATTALLLLTACGNDGDDGGESAAQPQTTDTGQPDPQNEDQRDSADPETFASAELQDGAGNPIGTVTVAQAEQGVRLSAEIDSLTAGYRAVAVHQNGQCEVASADEDGQVGDFNSAGEVLIGEQEEDPGVVEGEDGLAESPGQQDTDQPNPEQPDPEQQNQQPGAPEGEDPDGQNPEDQPGGQPGQQQDPPPGDGGQAPPGGPADPNAGAPFSAQLAGQVPAQQNPDSEDEQTPPRAQRAGSLPNLLINEDGTGYMEVVSGRLSEDLLLDDGGTAVIVYTGSDHHGNIPERYSPDGPDAGSLATGDAGERHACGVLEAAE